MYKNLLFFRFILLNSETNHLTLKNVYLIMNFFFKSPFIYKDFRKRTFRLSNNFNKTKIKTNGFSSSKSKITSVINSTFRFEDVETFPTWSCERVEIPWNKHEWGRRLFHGFPFDKKHKISAYLGPTQLIDEENDELIEKLL